MGLLDNLVSDLVKSSTGINARGFVRKVGGKNILLLGGAALAGAFAASQLGQKQPAAPTAPGRTPPPPPPPPPVPTTDAASAPPPVPNEAVPPPPVPLSAAAPQESRNGAPEEIPRELLWAIVRTMVTASLADGRLADDEKALIEKRVADSELSPEHREQLQLDFTQPPAVEQLAALVSDPEDAELLYRFGSLVLLADKDVSDLEKTWLNELARALKIPDHRKQMLDREIFS